MNETPKAKSGWRWPRRILITLAVLATLLAIFYTEEDWRGKHDWETYKHQLEAKGEKLDWQAFVPPAVPDDQNFFTAPIFTNMLDGKIMMTPYGNDGWPDIRPDASRSGYAIYRMQIADLQAWQNYYRDHPTNGFPVPSVPQTPAKDVLFALSKYDSAVEELRQASQRPYAAIPLNYADGFNTGGTLFPYLATLKRCTQLLQLRASAELADGQSAKALEDVKLLLYLNNSLRTSPFLISHLVRIAIVAIGMQPIWEGLAEHKWSDEQLAALETELGKMDFLADWESAMRGERVFAIASLENQRRTRKIISYADQRAVTNRLALMPGAFFYQSELEFARLYQDWVFPIVDTNSRTVSLAALQRLQADVRQEEKHYSPYKAEALLTAQAVGASARKFGITQAEVDLARVACALERYRLAHGEYPESLDALVPQFIEQLPDDVVNGQPLHYRLTDDGKFVLYSVGWNGTDDGGQVVFNKGYESVNPDEGDWVWKYPVR
ncbi:MAG TPA: hypothetical protein VMD27_06410 [Candidatus Aquilonibacter sp.]|nr:hypothetical protein [Candidatus Aquilonibacter sp.]